MKLTESTINLRAAQLSLKKEKKKNVWRMIAAGAGGALVGAVVMGFQ